jgi:hypothetical protein
LHVLLRLLPSLPASVLAASPLMPDQTAAADPTAAIFSRSHLEGQLAEVLKQTSSAHPRMHSLWCAEFGLIIIVIIIIIITGARPKIRNSENKKLLTRLGSFKLI